MKKKFIIILIALICLAAAGLFALSPFTFSTGIYINANDDIIVFDRGSGEPIVIRGRIGDFRTGDRILILHDGTMMLSYPAQMNVYFSIRLKKGDVSNVPRSVLDSLEEMGWHLYCTPLKSAVTYNERPPVKYVRFRRNSKSWRS